MEYLEIEGGRPLKGEVRIQGSKNVALPILSAVLLNPGVTVLHHCPKIIDVFYMLEILRNFGCQVKWERDSLLIDASCVYSSQVPVQYARKMRSSVLLLGSLLARMGKTFVPYPGGCVIGERPIDLHLEALRQLGTVLEEEEAGLWAVCEEPKGNHIRLGFPSVGATENILLLAVLAKGETVLENAAREPEIGELCRFLNSMGANIEGMGSGTLRIQGVKKLHDTEFTIAPDRIVTGTYLFLGAAAGGQICIENPPIGQLEALLKVLEGMGAVLTWKEGRLFLERRQKLLGIGSVKTAPYPGFPTDLQSPLLAALTLAEGESQIEERIFEARFKIVEELQRMGADIRIEGRYARIQGVSGLHGADVRARELRGGAALVLAAAAAEGKSRIFGYSYIARGYENIIRDLQALGVVVH